MLSKHPGVIYKSSILSLIKAFLYIFIVHPVIRVPNQLVGAPLGTDVTLECMVEASPKSINYWMKSTGMSPQTSQLHVPVFLCTLLII